MKIPFAYNLRNLIVRKTTTLMTVAGIALTVAVLVSSLALVEGLRATFANTGNPLQILVLRKGSNSELGSRVSLRIVRLAAHDARDRKGLIQSADGFARDDAGDQSPRVDNPKGMNVTLRGLLPAGIAMRSVHLATGRWFQAGQREVVVGKSIAQRYPDARVRSSSSLWPR